MMTIAKAWIASLRPKTLSASLVPVATAWVLAWQQSLPTPIEIALLCLGVAFTLQIATNFLNDVSDSDFGSDTLLRKGPKRGLHQKLISRKLLIKVSVFVLVLAALQGLYLVYRGGWPFAILGFLSLYLCYGYTAGHARLARRALGDLFVLIFFGWVATAGTFYLMTGILNVDIALLSTQVGLLSTVLIAINNYRDLEEDASTNKKTLAVLLGERRSRFYIYALLILCVGIQGWWILRMGLSHIIPLVSLLFFAVKISKDINLGPNREALNKTLAIAGANLVVFAIAFTMAMIWSF